MNNSGQNVIITDLIMKLSNNGKTDKEIAEVIYEKHNVELKTSAIKNRRARRRKSGVKKGNLINTPNNKTDKEYEIRNNDGSRELLKILKLTDEQKENDETILAEMGFNHNNWELLSLLLNTWGQSADVQLYQVKVKIKPMIKEMTMDEVIKRVNKITENIRPLKIKIIKPSDGYNEDLMMELGSKESHIGKKHLEGDIEELRFTELLTDILEKQSVVKAGLAYDKLGSDLFNSESNSMTTAGTPQYNIMTFEEMFDKVTEIYTNYYIKLLESFPKVYVQLVRGNHANALEFAFYRSIANLFKDEPRITFDKSYEKTQLYRFGECAIISHHGDFKGKASYTRFVQSLPKRFPLIFAYSKSIQLRMDHLHSSSSVEEFNGVEATRSRATSGSDEWHDNNSYIGARQGYEYYLQHAAKGEVARYRVNFDSYYDKKKDWQKVNKL